MPFESGDNLKTFCHIHNVARKFVSYKGQKTRCNQCDYARRKKNYHKKESVVLKKIKSEEICEIHGNKKYYSPPVGRLKLICDGCVDNRKRERGKNRWKNRTDEEREKRREYSRNRKRKLLSDENVRLEMNRKRRFLLKNKVKSADYSYIKTLLSQNTRYRIKPHEFIEEHVNLKKALLLLKREIKNANSKHE